MSDAPDVREWVLSEVRDKTSEDEPWTGSNALCQSVGGNHPIAREDVEDAIDALLDSGELIGWHGLITVCERERIQWAIQKEVEADITRSILVGKLNSALADLDDTDGDGELVTDGGLTKACPDCGGSGEFVEVERNGNVDAVKGAEAMDRIQDGDWTYHGERECQNCFGYGHVDARTGEI